MRGVVFDFDGVLVRSMELHAESYRRVLAPYKIRVEDADIMVREGGRSETILADLLATNGHRVDEEALQRLAEEKQRIFSTLGPPSLYPGAEAMVRQVRAGAPKLGLVTGTRRQNLDRFIPHLLPAFDAVLAQDAYQHDKPHPEPYLRAAQALGLPPAQLAAVENAIHGVQSARAAGYGLVVALPTTLSPASLEAAQADYVAPTHAAAGDYLTAWARTGRIPP